MAVIIGTRPEAIKLAPVVRALREPQGIEVIVIVTGQHRAMLDQMFEVLGLVADADLDLMQACQTLPELTSRALTAISGTLESEDYDAVVVQGDTTTAMCGALAAYYAGVPVAHVEAGLRSGWSRSPFPEEMNRRVIGTIASWHFAPTARAALAVSDAPKPRRVAITGNTSLDTLMWAMDRLGVRPACRPVRRVRRMFVTLHRRETQGERQAALCEMVGRLCERHRIVATLPVHPNPAVAGAVYSSLLGHERVRLVDPLDYFGCVREMANSDLVLTDSGGIQEEAPTLNVPVVVLRDTTDRPEAIDAGCAILASSDARRAEPQVSAVIEDRQLRARMASATNPYGDGRAAERIAGLLARDLTSSAGRRPGISASVAAMIGQPSSRLRAEALALDTS